MAVASPCVGACRLRLGKVCLGCGRHIDEIVEWLDATDARRLEIIEAAQRRRQELLPGTAGDDASGPR